MRVSVLSSGSKGNTTYIESNDTKILIDCGNTCKYVTNKLKEIGIEGNDLDAILVTHTHVDHIKGLKVFLKKYNIPVYIAKGMLDELDYLNNYHIIDNNIINIKDLVINVIKTSHDAVDSVGYIVSDNDKSIVYVTDTGYINKKYYEILSNRNIYIFESNHDVEMLNNGRYPFEVRKRILSDKGHLSNKDSSVYLAKLIGKNTKYVVLAHLSQENNTEDLAYSTLKDRLDDDNIDFDNIIIAKQDCETELLEV